MNMVMNPTLRIAQLLHLLRRVDGRKKLQKLVHILQELGYPFPERFEYSYYGMYSNQLRGELDSLAADNMITERESANVFGGPSFSFEITDRLETLLAEVGVGAGPKWAEVAKDLNALSAQILEGVSTLLFLRNRGLKATDLRERLLTLKPHLAECYSECERHMSKLLERKA